MKKKLLSIIAVLCVLICIALSIVLLDNVETYKFDNNAYYFVNGIVYDIPQGSLGKVDGDGNISFELKNALEDVEFSTLPAYYVNQNKIVTVDKLTYFYPNYDRLEKYCINPFTEVEFNYDSKFAKFSKNNQTRQNQYGFLYDGNGTYVFLDEFEIYFGDESYYLPALSYITVVKDSYIQFYDYSTDEFFEYEIDGSVYAVDSQGIYTLNMSYSTVDYSGVESILPASADILRVYLEGK